eukprot:CAMPEP_0176101670 /NCGR_PEP_ID=MMETSP0120_2-20121206/50994_1 /TAXON_ID=160619 /ORGANISM="Kryptoperidinium foliaceum, Strain CCMP 1326" /LENGTH=754 /DNA_ID=CAMNT_0017435721 /DNA_START=131 /DNA_END=2395 /DNA_ORIENTATION=+
MANGTAGSLDRHLARGNKIPKGAWMSGPAAAAPGSTRSAVAQNGDGSFMNLLSEFALSKDEVARMDRCVQMVQTMVDRGLSAEWRVEQFGSVRNGFGTRGSDLDLTVVSETSAEDCDGIAAVERLRDQLQPLLQEHPSFTVVQEIYGAKVPILKLRFEECLDVDISYQNVRALRNTRLLKAYASLNPAVQGLVIAVKLWAKSAGICGAAERNLSSYAFALMVIYYLQIELEMPCLSTEAFDNRGVGFEDPAVASATSAWQVDSHSPSSLVWGFFRFYASRFAWGREVVSIRLGKRSSRTDERFKRLSHRSVARLHIEDPYELDRNLHCVLGAEQEEKLIAALRKVSAGVERGAPPVGLGHLWGSPPSSPPPTRALDLLPATPPHTPQTKPSASPAMPPPLFAASIAAPAPVSAARTAMVAEGADAGPALVAVAPKHDESAATPPRVGTPEAVASAAPLLSTTPISPHVVSPPSPSPVRQEARDRTISYSPPYYSAALERAVGGYVSAVLEQPQATSEGLSSAASEASGELHAGDEGLAVVPTIRWLAEPPEPSAPLKHGSPLSDCSAGRWRSGSSQRSGARRAGSDSSTRAADSGSGASVDAQTDSEDTTCTAFDSGSTRTLDSGVGEGVTEVPATQEEQQPPPQEQQRQQAGELPRQWWRNMQSTRVQLEVEEALGASRMPAPPPRVAPTEAKVLEETRHEGGAPAAAVGASLALGGRPVSKSTAAIMQRSQKMLRAAAVEPPKPSPGVVVLQ